MNQTWLQGLEYCIASAKVVKLPHHILDDLDVAFNYLQQQQPSTDVNHRITGLYDQIVQTCIRCPIFVHVVFIVLAEYTDGNVASDKAICSTMQSDGDFKAWLAKAWSEELTSEGSCAPAMTFDNFVEAHLFRYQEEVRKSLKESKERWAPQGASTNEDDPCWKALKDAIKECKKMDVAGISDGTVARKSAQERDLKIEDHEGHRRWSKTINHHETTHKDTIRKRIRSALLLGWREMPNFRSAPLTMQRDGPKDLISIIYETCPAAASPQMAMPLDYVSWDTVGPDKILEQTGDDVDMDDVVDQEAPLHGIRDTSSAAKDSVDVEGAPLAGLGETPSAAMNDTMNET